MGDSVVADVGVVREIRDLARQSQLGFIDLDNGRKLVSHPTSGGGVTHEIIMPDGYEPAISPVIRAHPTLVSKDSFVDYINSFKSADARLFADLDRTGGGKFVCVLDYHAAGPGLGGNARRTVHRVTYALRDSEEWTRWSQISGKLMSQPKFVQFLEENAADISAPSGADILELAKDFSAARRVDFTQTLRTDTGDISFEYAANAEAKSKAGQIEVPRKFELTIPVFYGEPTMKVYAFLRWSIDAGKLEMGIDLHRAVSTRQALFEGIGADIAGKTAVPLHYGSPS